MFLHSDGAPKKKTKLQNKFTVFVLHNEMTAAFEFSDRKVPTTREEFWQETGVDDRIRIDRQAHVSVRMEEGWSTLDRSPKSTARYKVDPKDGVIFQLSPYRTLTSSPSDSTEQRRNIKKTKAEFKSLIGQFFQENPFANCIPATYEDIAIQKLRRFLQLPSNTTDSEVLALVLAMPGSGKTRTVVEAVQGARKYHRIKMANRVFHDAGSIQKFVETSVSEASGEEKICDGKNGVVVVHFDEIQALMVTPESCKESLVATLSKAIDSAVNHFYPPRSWLKFVLTGTNVFTRTTIKIGTDVKALPIALDGSFSLEFVSNLANEHEFSHLLVGTDYLERCRHNRRFTQQFFASLWDGIKTANSNVESAYRDAFALMKEQMSNQFENGVRASQVACSVFAKIIAIPEDEVNSGVVFLRNCSELEKSYIAGGGLNV